MNCHFQLAPNSIQSFFDLLKKCSSVGKVLPIKKACLLPEEYRKGDLLPLEIFTRIVAYPLQSLAMTRLEKFTLLQEIRRIYPKDQVDLISFQKIDQVIKNIIPCPDDPQKALDFVPVGLDNFQYSFTQAKEDEVEKLFLEPKIDHLKKTVFFNPQEIRENGYRIAIQDITQIHPVHEQVVIFNELLNMILLEQYTMQLTWEYLEICELFDQLHKQSYIPQNLATEVEIRYTQDKIQFLPKDENLYETITIEELALLMKEQEALDSFSKNQKILTKKRKGIEKVKTNYNDFQEIVKENSHKIFARNEDNLDAFLHLQSNQLKSEIIERLEEFSIIHPPTETHALSFFTPFYFLLLLVMDHDQSLVQEKMNHYILPMRPLDFCKKLFLICSRYQEQFHLQKKIYQDCYEALVKIRKQAKKLGAHFEIKFNFPSDFLKTSGSFYQKRISLPKPEEMPKPCFPPFGSIENSDLCQKKENRSLPLDLSSLKEELFVEKEEKLSQETITPLKQSGKKWENDQHDEKLYRNQLKNQEFDKEVSRNFSLEQKIVVKGQGLSEEKNFGEELTQARTDSSTGFAIKTILSEEEQKALVKERKSPNNPSPSFPLKNSFSFDYADRVNRWFSANLPLNSTAFPEYQTNSLNHQAKMVLFHGFSLEVDFLIEKIAYFFTQPNETTGQLDRCYAIAGEINHNGRIYRGIFYYAIGADNKIYHRYFSQKKSYQLVEIVRQAFYQIDFPELEIESEFPGPIQLETNLAMNQETIVQDSQSGIIKIENKETHTIISLIPIKN